MQGGFIGYNVEIKIVFFLFVIGLHTHVKMCFVLLI